MLAGLNGLWRSAEQEHPGRLRCRMLAVASLDDLGSIMEAEAGGTANLVRYGQQGRKTLRYKEVPLEKSPVPWRDNGVYWITGGFGGLGRLFVREAAHQARNPVLILSSRNGGSGQEAFLDGLRGLGARFEAHSLDVADAAAVRSLAAQILEQHGNINGIVHGAGVLQDGLLMHKQAESLHKVLSPKIFGLENLDAATADLPLDWIVACPSISAAWGNPGQSDYASANGFMVSFAVFR